MGFDGKSSSGTAKKSKLLQPCKLLRFKLHANVAAVTHIRNDYAIGEIISLVARRADGVADSGDDHRPTMHAGGDKLAILLADFGEMQMTALARG